MSCFFFFFSFGLFVSSSKLSSYLHYLLRVSAAFRDNERGVAQMKPIHRLFCIHEPPYPRLHLSDTALILVSSFADKKKIRKKKNALQFTINLISIIARELSQPIKLVECVNGEVGGGLDGGGCDKGLGGAAVPRPLVALDRGLSVSGRPV